MNATQWPEQYVLHVQKEIGIEAKPVTVFESILEQLGEAFDTPDGKSMAMKLEAWPGGRWYRDLGDNAGHLWGHVQVIKPPMLLEIMGPMFMSYPVMSHIQYRVTEEAGGCKLTMIHRAIGDINPEHRQGVGKGWQHIIESIKRRAQK